MTETNEKKRVLVPRSLANDVISDGPQEFMWDGDKIVITEDDIPYEDLEDCCFRSASMLDTSNREEEMCHKCGRVFNVIQSNLERFDESHSDDEIVALVPQKEFLQN